MFPVNLRTWLLNHRQASSRRPRQARTCRPELLLLEDRLAPASIPNALITAPDTTYQDTQSDSSVAVLGSTVLVAYRDSGSNVDGNRFTGYSRSTDGGLTFTDMGALTSANDDNGSPVLAHDATSGRVYLATQEFQLHGIQVFRSDDGGTTFQAPVNAFPGYSGLGLTRESLAVDNFPGSGQGNIYVAAQDAGNGIVFSRSLDGGSNWQAQATPLASAGTGNVQAAFVTVGTDHSVYVFWFDDTTGSQLLRMRRSTNQGATFGPAVTVATLHTTGANGDLDLGFRTSVSPQVAVNPVSGHLYVAFNDDPAGADRSDVFFTMSSDNGSTWSPPAKVNDDATLNDNWQPAIAVNTAGTRVFIGWIDRRLDPANSLIDAYGSIGTVSGASVAFGANFRISSESFPAVFGQDFSVDVNDMGNYGQAAADNNTFYYSWADNRRSNPLHAHQPDVRVARIAANPGGPFVTSAPRHETVAGPVSSVVVAFSEPMDTNSFALSDVVRFWGPAGDLTGALTGFTWVDNQHLRVEFTSQANRGDYGLVLGPQILSAAGGRAMDDNLNGTSGEASDHATTSFTIEFGSKAPYTATNTTPLALDLQPADADVTAILTDDDDGTAAVGLAGHHFTFFGTTYDSLFVAANGLITFGSANGPYANSDLAGGPSQAAIAALWDDLVTNIDDSDQVLVAFRNVRGDATPELVIEWSNAHYITGDGTDPITFQAVLQLDTTNDGEVLLNYSDLTDTTSSQNAAAAATVGIKQAGTGPAGWLQVWKDGSGSNAVGSGQAILFAPQSDLGPPVVDGGGPYSVLKGNAGKLAATATDPDGANTGLLFLWDFDGDGNFGETGEEAGRGDERGRQPTFLARNANAGPLDVQLRVFDAAGASTTRTVTIAITNADPGGPYSVPEGGSVPLHGSATGGSATIDWDLDGDGVFGETGADAARGDENVANPVFSAAGLDGPGTFDVKVRARDNAFGEAIETTSITITNADPTGNSGGPYSVQEDGTVQLNGSASDPAGANDPLTVTWDLDGDGVFGETGVAASRGDETGLTPTFSAAGLEGPSSFSVKMRVTDGDGGVSVTTGSISIGFVNDAPSFVKGANQEVNEDAGSQSVPGWATSLSAGPASESAQTLTFQVTANSNPDLFIVAPAVSSNGTLTYTLAPDANGSATITLVVKDNGGTANGGHDTSTSQTFVITVKPVNDVPSFVKGADEEIDEDAGPQSVTNWASGLLPGPADEFGQTLTFQVTANTNPGLFSAGPAVSSNGTLTYTPAQDANGTATITLVVKDNGGTADGGHDTSALQTFVITVRPVNDAPVLDTSLNPVLKVVPKLTTLSTQFEANLPGDPVSALLGGVTDPDIGALRGAAVIGVTGPNNGWQFSADGVVWVPFGAVSSSLARLLPSTYRVRFVPPLNYTGPASLSYRAWDQTSGTAGLTADVASPTAFGGTTAFSAAVEDATLKVATTLVSVREDTAAFRVVGTLWSSLFSPQFKTANPLFLRGIAVTAVDNSNGTWQYTVNGTTYINVPAVSPNAALLLKSISRLRFVPKANFNGTATVTYQGWNGVLVTADALVPGGGGARRGDVTATSTRFSATPDTSVVVVTPVSDRLPLLNISTSPALTAVSRTNINPAGDTVASFAAGLISNLDAGGLVGIAVTRLVASTALGTWQYSTDRGVTWRALGPVSTISARLLGANDMIRFLPKKGTTFTGTVSFNFRAWDGSAGKSGGLLNPLGAAFSTATETVTLQVTA